MRYSIVFAAIVAVAASAPIDIPITVDIDAAGLVELSPSVDVATKRGVAATLAAEVADIETQIKNIEAAPDAADAEVVAVLATLEEDLEGFVADLPVTQGDVLDIPNFLVKRQELPDVPDVTELPDLSNILDEVEGLTGKLPVKRAVTETVQAEIDAIKAEIEKVEAIPDLSDADVAAIVEELEDHVTDLVAALNLPVKRAEIPSVHIDGTVEQVDTTVNTAVNQIVKPVIADVTGTLRTRQTVPDVDVDGVLTTVDGLVSEVEGLVQGEVPDVPGVGTVKLPVRN